MGPLTYFNHFFIGILLGFILGGKFIRLGQLPIRLAWLAIVLLAGRVIVTSKGIQGTVPEWVLATALLALLAGLLALFWVNRRLAGVWLMALGGASNMLVMAANDGFMPVVLTDFMAERAPKSFAILQSGERLMHTVAMTDETRLRWLADWIVVPAVLWIPAIASIGDVLIGIGLSYLLVCGMLGRPYGWRGPQLTDPADKQHQAASAPLT